MPYLLPKVVCFYRNLVVPCGLKRRRYFFGRTHKSSACLNKRSLDALCQAQFVTIASSFETPSYAQFGRLLKPLSSTSIMNLALKTENRILEGIFEYPLPIERVLYEAEQPIVYLTKTKQGQMMLAYLSQETDSHQFVIVAPTTQSSIIRLENGALGLLEALTETWMWVIRTSFTQGDSEVWSITEDTIPELNLPKPGTPLFCEHRIALSEREIGDD